MQSPYKVLTKEVLASKTSVYFLLLCNFNQTNDSLNEIWDEIQMFYKSVQRLQNHTHTDLMNRQAEFLSVNLLVNVCFFIFMSLTVTALSIC